MQERACGMEDLKKRLGGSVQKGVCYVGGRVWVKGGMKGGGVRAQAAGPSTPWVLKGGDSAV